MKIISSRHAHDLLKRKIRTDVEEFWVVALTSDKAIIRSSMIFRGTVDKCLVHPRDIFRFLISTNASSYLVAHNHPMGPLYPSNEDIEFTKNLRSLSDLMGIELLDHLIVGRTKYFSFGDNGVALG